MSGRVVYTCPFIPAEWIEAHALQPSRLPVRLIDSTDVIGSSPGVCPYARAFASTAVHEKEAAGIIVTTACDQMRRASEFIARGTNTPVFLMHLPHTWQTPGAYKLYIDELQRLGQFLIRIGGNPPQKLAEIMLRYDSDRAAIRDAKSRLSAWEYAELIMREQGTGDREREKAIIPEGVPVALIGGPLMADDFDIFDTIEQSGGYVALDATETGERTLPAPFDRRGIDDDPLRTLADAYFGSIPDAFRRPNSLLYKWLKRELNANSIRGIIFRRYLWCDTWNAEAARIRDWAKLPFLHLDVDSDETDSLRTASRIKSFIEVLK